MISKSLSLPDGYQSFDGYSSRSRIGPKYDHQRITVNNVDVMRAMLRNQSDLRLYTQHEIYFEQGILKQTRTSPNWEGGLVTYATCKHLMRVTDTNWLGTWIASLSPADCCGNTVLFCGMVNRVFNSNFALSRAVKKEFPEAYKAKLAMGNPRGDLYTPQLLASGDDDERRYNHENFLEPSNHTRSVEFYKKSPGSTSDREDGKIPKWWRDIEYLGHGRRPKCFILSPCFLFSEPMLWTSYNPRRAALRLTANDFLASLRNKQ